mgnify:CR=1 FL=1
MGVYRLMAKKGAAFVAALDECIGQMLDDGTIAGMGTHDELMQKGGGYAKLFEVQSRYYREGREF